MNYKIDNINYPYFKNSISREYNSGFIYDRETKKSYSVTEDGWEILKHVNGENNIKDIFKLVNEYHFVDYESLLRFFQHLNMMGIIIFSEVKTIRSLLIKNYTHEFHSYRESS